MLFTDSMASAEVGLAHIELSTFWAKLIDDWEIASGPALRISNV
jgi:hypothetical protein